MKKTDRLLVKILFFSIILFAVSIVFSKRGKTSPKGVESSLLNPKYKNEVSQIEIQTQTQTGQETILIKKQGDFWLLLKNDGESGHEICTFADKRIVQSLIETMSSLRKLYQISDRESDFGRLGTTENTGTTLIFSKNNDKLYTKLYIGAENALTNRTFVRSESSKITFETENTFSQYLTTDTNYWSEGEIFTGITSPVHLTFTEIQPPETQSIDEKTQDFTAKTKTILSLRHGNIRSTQDSLLSNPCATLSVQDGNGRITQLQFFTSGEESYLYTKQTSPSPVDSQENTFALYSENAAYEISSWTYTRLKSLF